MGVTGFEQWANDKLERLVVLADELIEDVPAGGEAALHAMRAAAHLARSRRQDERVYRAAIRQLRQLLARTERMRARVAADKTVAAEELPNVEKVAEGYRELILRLNPRAVIGDLL